MQRIVILASHCNYYIYVGILQVNIGPGLQSIDRYIKSNQVKIEKSNILLKQSGDRFT